VLTGVQAEEILEFDTPSDTPTSSATWMMKAYNVIESTRHFA
jgi:hypothetical protein